MPSASHQCYPTRAPPPSPPGHAQCNAPGQGLLNDLVRRIDTLVTITTFTTSYEGYAYSNTNDPTDSCIILSYVKDLSAPRARLIDSLFVPVSTVHSWSFTPSDAESTDNNDSWTDSCVTQPTFACKQKQAGHILILEDELDRCQRRLTTLDAELMKEKRKRWEERARAIKRINQDTEMLISLKRELRDMKVLEKSREEEREKERAREAERHRQSQAARHKLESELENLKALERERGEERAKERIQEVERQRQAQTEKERLEGILYPILSSSLLRPSTMEALPKNLQSADAQFVVDYLNNTLYHSNIFQRGERKRALQLLSEICKSAQVFPKAIELNGVECDLGQSVSEGGFGMIYKGKLQEETVCIKAVRVYQSGAVERELRAQAGELVLGSHVSHPNILPFYGAFLSNEAMPRICIVSPWIEGGNLIEYLHDHPDTARIPLVSDILSGLQYLHEMEIVHADLKGSNVLISQAQRAVLADFGLSSIAMTSIAATSAANGAGTTNWMAPELLAPEFDEPPRVTRQSDIWAFGCICYEILAGKIPFNEYKRQCQLISAFISRKAKLYQPDATPTISNTEEIWSLAESCLNYDPGKRPTANEALKIILDLNVKDERPQALNTTIKRPKSATQVDFDLLLSIVERVSQNY